MSETTQQQDWTVKGKRVYDERGQLVARATSREAARLLLRDHLQAERFRVIKIARALIADAERFEAEALSPKPLAED